MFESTPRQQVVYGALRSVGLGLLAGGLEAMGLAATLELPLGFGSFLALGLANVALMGLVGFLAGLVGGPLSRLLRRDAWPSQVIATQMGIAGALLCGWYLWEAAAIFLAEDRSAPAAVMAIMPVAFGGVVYFNAAYWLRKVEIGKEYKVGFVAASAAVAVALVTVAAGIYAGRYTGGGNALATDPKIVLITVDGLRWDRVFGDEADMPRLQALANESVVFLDAVTPSPLPLAANAAALTGRHPLRHGLFTPGDRLARDHFTLAEALATEGYTTGGFVSSGALGAGSGLSRGFYTYDDAVGGGLMGLSRISPVRRLGVFGAAHRPAAATTDALLDWMSDHADGPFFGWLHLDTPRVGADYDAAVAEADVQIGRVLDALDEAGFADDSMVIVVGTGGRMLGEHGLTGQVGLYDEVVRVPLVVRTPQDDVTVRQVEPQVRLMDLAPAVAGLLELRHFDATESIDLMDYATGFRKRTISTSLVGRAGDDLFDSVLLGLRNNGVKYIRHVRTGEEELYLLTSDPSESSDLSESALDALDEARGMVLPEEAALRRLLLE